MSKGAAAKAVGNAGLTLLGAMFVVWSIGKPLLRLVGEREAAVIHSVKRQYGDRDESNPNRYSYAVSYRFKLPDGTSREGSTYRIGTFTQAFGLPANNRTHVRYLKRFPAINALEDDTIPTHENLILLATGLVLVFRKRLSKKYGERNAGDRHSGPHGARD